MLATQEAELRAGLGLVVEDCGTIRSFGSGVTAEGARGTITNNGASSVDVFVEVDFESGTGLILYQGNAWVTSLGPGRSAQWESVSVNEEFSQCKGRIESVFPS